MALNRKYAALPDLDSAPDIYETPELTDGASTIPTSTTAQTRSRSSSYSSHDSGDEQAISHARLQPSQARTQFSPAQVDARNVDFSDRVTGKRKSYKVSTRRRRKDGEDPEEIGDFSDEEDETLERKLARLRREIEEVKDEVGKRNAERQKGANSTNQEGPEVQAVDGLSDVLEGLNMGVNGTREGAQTILAKKLGTSLKSNGKPTAATTDSKPLPNQIAESTNYVVSYAPSYTPSHALAKAAAFDTRLTLLEKLLGLSNPSLPPESSRPILPALEQLTSQLNALSTTSASSLDTLSRRVRQLTTEADALAEKRRLAEGQGTEDGATNVNGNGKELVATDVEQSTKINALFGSLSTIENLHPLLPALLERLRSLRKIHGEAASVAENLDGVEKRQRDMSAEIERWTAGLEKVEKAVANGESVLKSNVGVVEGWVKGLEERMQKLS